MSLDLLLRRCSVLAGAVAAVVSPAIAQNSPNGVRTLSPPGAIKPTGAWESVASARSAPTLGLQWEGDAKVSVGGVASSPRLLSGRSSVWVYGVDTEGVVFNITGSPRRLWVADQTNDLPAGMIRPSDTEPFNEGDRTQVFAAVALGH
jgi:hypothetical protein